MLSWPHWEFEMSMKDLRNKIIFQRLFLGEASEGGSVGARGATLNADGNAQK
jgi:hypothetical protein